MIEAKNFSKRFGDRLLFENLSFNIPKGAIVGIIGPNGAGKSTFFKILMGKKNQIVVILRLGETVHLAYVDQSRDSLDGAKTVWEEISDGQDIMTIGILSNAVTRLCRTF